MEPKVIHDREKARFEVNADLHKAVLEYKATSRKIYLIHTGVPKELEGRGIAASLASAALKYAKETGLETVIICPYVKAYVKRHPEVLEGLKYSFYP